MGLTLRVFPELSRFPARFARLSPLINYGGWITLTNLIVPVFFYFDRFLIGSLLSLGAVTYYTAPFELVTKLLIIPVSLSSVLFPAFSRFASSGSRDRLSASVMRSTKYLIIAMSPLILFSLIYSDKILDVWLGSDFAAQSAGVFRFLALGVLLNAIGYVPFALVQGVGRPDVVAKYHLIELPFYIGVVYFLTLRFGIQGAALAFCLRMLWTIPIFFVICIKAAGISPGALLRSATSRSIASTAGLAAGVVVLGFGSNWAGTNAGLTGLSFLPIYGLLVWYFILDPSERKFIRNLLCQPSKCLFERGGSFDA